MCRAEKTLKALQSQNLANHDPENQYPEDQDLGKRNDERLQVEAARQDPARFAELYENNFERVYAYIARRVGNREDAQDATADVFHRAITGISRFEWRGLPFAAWLLGIAANVLSDRWRGIAQRQEVAANEDELEQIGIEDDV